MKKSTVYLAIALAAVLTAACHRAPEAEPRVEGHYTYEHQFDYYLSGNHLEVYETGTMDFRPDGSALDSAYQRYKVTFQDSSQAMIGFIYVSPSRWSLDDDTLRFCGIKDSFRMDVHKVALLDRCDEVEVAKVATETIKAVGGSIDHEYLFNLDTLTAEKMQWSYTYSDGHADTWEFFRDNDRKHSK